MHVVYCQTCGGDAGLSDRYCRFCGAKIPVIPVEASHRFVTVLCTDLSGYTPLAERLDPEDLKDCMTRIMGEVTGIIIHYGGTVEKYIGDAVVAIFGLHKAREGDPIRAVLAALQIHRYVEGLDSVHPSIRLGMHSGIHVGVVVMDTSGSGTFPHGVLGKPINIASRLCDLASEGEILLGEDMVTEVARQFNLEWKGTKVLKGVTAPISVYRVLDEKINSLTVHRNGGATSPLVGREQELSVVISGARRLASREGGIICIHGDAGIGKSRLIQECMRDICSWAHFFLVSCFDHAGAIPYFPFFKLVPLAMGMVEMRDVPRQRSSGCLPPDHVKALEFFIHGSPGGEEGSRSALREKLSDAVLWLFNEVSSMRPSVFCIEDIHWADQSTLDLVAYLVNAWGNECPCLLILSHRPGWRPKFEATEVCLKELREPEVRSILSHMLDNPSIPEAVVKGLNRATGGNPFFLEELVNYLLEKGFDISDWNDATLPCDVPASLYGLISSRIDHMDAAPRRMMQEASLIGRTFSKDMIASVSSGPDHLDMALQDLVSHGFICPLDAHEYAFKHDIIRDVASRALLKRERVIIHRKIARTLEEPPCRRPGEDAEIIAYHYVMAREYAKALRYYLEAARRCQGSDSWIEGASHFRSAEQILEATADIPDREEKLQTVREGIWNCCRVFDPAQAAAALEWLSVQYRRRGLKKEEAFSFIRLINLYSQQGLFDKALQAYDNALALCWNDTVLAAAARTAVAYTHTFLGSPLVALDLLDDARPPLETSERFLRAVNYMSTLAANVWKSDMDSAREWYARTKELSGDYLDIDLMADMWLAHICCLQGRFEEARRVFGHVSRREKKLGRLAGGLSYLRIQGSIYFRSRYFGDLQCARSDLEQFEALGTQIQGADSLKGLYRAWIALEEGRVKEAQDLVQRALPGLKAGIANRVPYALNVLSEARCLLGDAHGARRTAQECIVWNERSGNGDQLIWALRLFADACVRQGDYASAQKALVRAYRHALLNGLNPHRAWILSSWGTCFLSSGSPRKAAVCYAASRRYWEEMGNAVQAERVARLMEGPVSG